MFVTNVTTDDKPKHSIAECDSSHSSSSRRPRSITCDVSGFICTSPRRAPKLGPCKDVPDDFLPDDDWCALPPIDDARYDSIVTLHWLECYKEWLSTNSSAFPRNPNSLTSTARQNSRSTPNSPVLDKLYRDEADLELPKRRRASWGCSDINEGMDDTSFRAFVRKRVCGNACPVGPYIPHQNSWELQKELAVIGEGSEHSEVESTVNSAIRSIAEYCSIVALPCSRANSLEDVKDSMRLAGEEELAWSRPRFNTSDSSNLFNSSKPRTSRSKEPFKVSSTLRAALRAVNIHSLGC